MIYYTVREGSNTGAVVAYGTLPISFYVSSNSKYYVDVYDDNSCSTNGTGGLNGVIFMS